MGDEQRHRRLRVLLKKLNKERKKQARQIDILCNDLIGAQRNFIGRLKVISFIANFCESMIGAGDLNGLLCTAAKIIKAETSNASVIFFLKQGDEFQLHVLNGPTPEPGPIRCGTMPDRTVGREHLETCFTPELMDNICKSNRVCTLDDMFALGLQGNPTELARYSVVSIPLVLPGLSLGFMLLARPIENVLTAGEIEKVTSVTYGLSRAIAGFVAVHTS